MKKFSLILCLVLLLAAAFSFTACDEKENGVTIKYAKVSFSFTDKDGNDKNEDVTLKLYVNYAPETIAQFTELANKGFYDGSVVNHIDSGFITLGGYKLTDGKLTALTSGKKLTGEFVENGWRGNMLSVTEGVVVMYREPANIDNNNFDTADCRIAICTSASAFSANEYCVIGKLEDSTKIDVIKSIAALQSKTEGEVTEYNRYYVGGLKELATKFYNDETLSDSKGLDKKEIEKFTETGALYSYIAEEGTSIDDDDYSEISSLASQLVNAYGSKLYAYFYNMPVNTVTVSKVTVSSKK